MSTCLTVLLLPLTIIATARSRGPPDTPLYWFSIVSPGDVYAPLTLVPAVSGVAVSGTTWPTDQPGLITTTSWPSIGLPSFPSPCRCQLGWRSATVWALVGSLGLSGSVPV